MTETTARVRWTDSRNSPADPALAGSIGDLHLLFKIWPPEDPGDEWLLTTTLPGKEGERLYGFPIDLKAEAERWLEQFVSSLGAVFPAEREEFEFPRDSIDLEVAFDLGAYVRYQHPDAGWEDDQEAGRKFLTHGRLYRVAWNDIGQSKTRIGLVGVDGSFNSVLFEPVADEDVTDAEAAEVARRCAPGTSAPRAGEKEPS